MYANTCRNFSDPWKVVSTQVFITNFHMRIDFIRISCSCTPDREIQRFTPREKFLSHPRYLTPSHAAFKCSFLTLVV